MAIAGFSRIGVVGAGQMGLGIAQLCASRGLNIILGDSYQAALDKAKVSIQASVRKLADKGQLSPEQLSQVETIHYTREFTNFASCELVIEAVPENEGIKRQVFQALDELLPQASIIASNTSSLPITRLASVTKRADRFVGMHFMNPVPLMKLVEVIPGLATDPQVTARVVSLAVGLGKEVSQSRDFPGFVVNRILMPMINEAFTALCEGVASPEDIDKGMRLGTNQPMGPLALADFIGLDTCLAILEVLHKGLGEPRYRPSPLLRQYVEAGWFGRKSGRGVFIYTKQP